MKKIILVIFVLIAQASSVCAYSMEEFKQLSPEKQVRLWLDTYKNDPNCFSRLRYAQTVGYFQEYENIQVYKFLLIESLRASHLSHFRNLPRDFAMISQLLYESIYFSQLNNDEKQEVYDIVNCKLNEYVTENKTIDSEVLYYTVIAKKFRDNLDYFPDYENPNTLLQYYENQGISGLTIDWADIEEHYHISRE